MANPEYIDILKQGAGVWNQWRDENPGIQPDLAEADLRSAYLREVNLPGTPVLNLTGGTYG
jgi:hypothetical protein